MRLKVLALLAAGMLYGPMSANAALLGSWDGQWVNGSYAADFDLTFDSQTPAGAFTGYFDWFCTAGLTCSGREFFSGTLSGSSLSFLSFATTSIAPGAVNIVFSTYSGSLLDPNTLSGTDSGGGQWRAVRVPEPGTLALLGLGLMGLGLVRRKSH